MFEEEIKKDNSNNQTKYIYAVQGNYGDGYEDLTGEETFAEAKDRLKEYRENERGTSFRIQKVKESIFDNR